MTAANNDSNDNSQNNNLRNTSDELKKKIDKGGGTFLYSTYEINTNMMIGYIITILINKICSWIASYL